MSKELVDKMTASTPTQVENEYGFLISGKYLAKFNETVNIKNKKFLTQV